jgi:arylsulfatase A-like enzyme
MDRQMGRLRAELQTLGVAENTMLWFCSDNGPEGQAGKAPGSAGKLRGRKRSLFEGGVRVPGLLVWPAKIGSPRTVDLPYSTLDYYPTILDVLGIEVPSPDVPNQPMPIDGVSLLPLIDGKMTARPAPIAFESRGQVALIDNRYKLIRVGASQRNKPTSTGGSMLFDLQKDPSETTDLAAQQPETVKAMKQTLLKWQASCRNSAAGHDYRQ